MPVGIYEEELDNVFHTADVNRDGVLNVKEVLLGAAIVYERYNQMLAPEVRAIHRASSPCARHTIQLTVWYQCKCYIGYTRIVYRCM